MRNTGQDNLLDRIILTIISKELLTDTTKSSIVTISAVNPKNIMMHIYQVAIMNKQERSLFLRRYIYKMAVMNI